MFCSHDNKLANLSCMWACFSFLLGMNHYVKSSLDIIIATLYPARPVNLGDGVCEPAWHSGWEREWETGEDYSQEKDGGGKIRGQTKRRGWRNPSRSQIALVYLCLTSWLLTYACSGHHQHRIKEFWIVIYNACDTYCVSRIQNIYSFCLLYSIHPFKKMFYYVVCVALQCTPY